MKIGGIIALVALAIVVIFGSILFAASSEKVAAGTVAVVTRNGADVDLESPGRVWLTPGIESTEAYQTSVLNLEFTGNEKASKAAYTDSVITQKTKDGVDTNFAAMLYFQIPEESVRQLYRERGRSQDKLVTQHIQVITRDVARDVIEQNLIDDMYLGGMENASNQVEEKLRDRFAEIGIELKSFDFTAIDPSDAYKLAIEQQVEQQQQADLEAEKVKVSEQQAEQKRVTAEGDAKVKQINAEAEANAEVIRAEGEAKANNLRSESLTPEILQAMYYDALKTINWAILESSEGAQPMMPIEAPAPTETPAN